MATLRDIKLRIKGVKNTQKITNAMKMVAAAKLRKAQELVVNARPYAHKISEMIYHLSDDAENKTSPFFAEREIKNVAIVVVSADRGLCGAFNANILKETQRYIVEEINNISANVKLYCIGKKGFDFFKKLNYPIIESKTGIFSSINYKTASDITDKLISDYLNGEIDKIVFIYNEFKSIINQKIVNETFLPIKLENEIKEKSTKNTFYIYEPDKNSIIDYLIPKHLKAQVWRFLLESNASELGARMTAMDNATTNARDLIKSLTVTYNKERQAAITKEILEIVSGANALQQG